MIVSDNGHSITIIHARGSGFVVSVEHATGVRTFEHAFHTARPAAQHIRQQLIQWEREAREDEEPTE